MSHAKTVFLTYSCAEKQRILEFSFKVHQLYQLTYAAPEKKFGVPDEKLNFFLS